MVLQDSKLFGNLVSWNGELNEISAEVRLFARKLSRKSKLLPLC